MMTTEQDLQLQKALTTLIQAVYRQVETDREEDFEVAYNHELENQPEWTGMSEAIEKAIRDVDEAEEAVHILVDDFLEAVNPPKPKRAKKRKPVKQRKALVKKVKRS